MEYGYCTFGLTCMGVLGRLDPMCYDNWLHGL